MAFHDLLLERKREDAISWLGVNWVLHPNYSRVRNPHHDLHNRNSETLRVFCLEMAEARKENRVATLLFMRHAGA